jgi:hypothetical protein
LLADLGKGNLEADHRELGGVRNTWTTLGLVLVVDSLDQLSERISQPDHHPPKTLDKSAASRPASNH